MSGCHEQRAEIQDNANSIYALLNHEIDGDMNGDGNTETTTFKLSQDVIINIWIILFFCLLSLTVFCWFKSKLNKKYETKIIETEDELA